MGGTVSAPCGNGSKSIPHGRCAETGQNQFRTGSARKRVEINSARKRGVTYLAGQLGSPVYTDGDHTHGFKNMFFDPTRRDLSIGATFEALKTGDRTHWCHFRAVSAWALCGSHSTGPTSCGIPPISFPHRAETNPNQFRTIPHMRNRKPKKTPSYKAPRTA